MAPEMAASYIVGIFPSLGVTALHYRLHNKKIRKAAFRQLQDNLAQIHKFWCDSQSRILSLQESNEQQDYESFMKSLKIMGFLFALLSWVGFIFNTVILLSIHKIAVSRLEQKVFLSELCQRKVSPQEAETILKELEA